MPARDGTGPAGMGPMTGRAAGYCVGFAMPDYMNPPPGRGNGYGRGQGFGCGFGCGFGAGVRGGRGRRWTAPDVAPPVAYVPPFPSAQQELDVLKTQAQNVETALESITARISELETGTSDA